MLSPSSTPQKKRPHSPLRYQCPTVEPLEPRIVPAWIIDGSEALYVGTDGNDSVLLFRQEGVVQAIQFVRNGESQLNVTVLPPEVEQIAFVMGGGADSVSTNGLAANLYVDLGDGNDSLSVTDGPEGATTTVAIGGEGNDVLTGGDGNGLLIGDAFDTSGTPLLEIQADGGEGQTETVSVPGPVEELTSAWSTPGFTHERVAEVLKLDRLIEDNATDAITAGFGFAMQVDSEVSYHFDRPQSGPTIQVTTSQELLTALDSLQPGTAIELAAGTYDVGHYVLSGNQSGVTIAGAGMGQTVVRGLRLDKTGSFDDELVFRDLTFDMTSVNSGGQGSHWILGKVVYDRVEMFGSDGNMLYALNYAGPTHVMTLHSYFHHAERDIISTSGSSSTPEDNAASIVELFATEAHDAGPSITNQVVTAHNGFRVASVQGIYHSAEKNAVAPDANSRIDHYFDEIFPGSRNGGVEFSQVGGIVYGSLLLDLTFTPVYDNFTVEMSELRTRDDLFFSTFLVLGSNVTVRASIIGYDNPGGDTLAMRLDGGNNEIVDVVFQDWDGQILIDNGEDNLVEGLIEI